MQAASKSRARNPVSASGGPKESFFRLHHSDNPPALAQGVVRGTVAGRDLRWRTGRNPQASGSPHRARLATRLPFSRASINSFRVNHSEVRNGPLDIGNSINCILAENPVTSDFLNEINDLRYLAIDSMLTWESE